MGWDGPILTDSGGYQVFSLRDLTKVTEEGVKFRSPHDGQYRTLTPEVSVDIQETLGVDMAMAFDECIEWPADRERVGRSTARGATLTFVAQNSRSCKPWSRATRPATCSAAP